MTGTKRSIVVAAIKAGRPIHEIARELGVTKGGVAAHIHFALKSGEMPENWRSLYGYGIPAGPPAQPEGQADCAGGARATAADPGEGEGPGGRRPDGPAKTGAVAGAPDLSEPPPSDASAEGKVGGSPLLQEQPLPPVPSTDRAVTVWLSSTAFDRIAGMAWAARVDPGALVRSIVERAAREGAAPPPSQPAPQADERPARPDVDISPADYAEAKPVKPAVPEAAAKRTTPKGGAPSNWTPEREARAIELYRAGASARDAGAEFGLTKSAMIGKWQRLGMKGRPKPLTTPPPPPRRGVHADLEARDALIADLAGQKTPNKIIARQLGMTPRAVISVIERRRRDGAKIPARANGPHPVTVDDEREPAPGTGWKDWSAAEKRWKVREAAGRSLTAVAIASEIGAPNSWAIWNVARRSAIVITKEARTKPLVHKIEPAIEPVTSAPDVVAEPVNADPFPQPRPDRWTDMTREQRIEAVREGAAEGLSSAQICERVGAPTRNVIMGVAARAHIRLLGIGGTPAWKSDGQRKPRRSAQTPAKQNLTPRGNVAPQPKVLRAPKPAPAPVIPLDPMPLLGTGTVSFLDRRHFECAAPDWPHDLSKADLASLARDGQLKVCGRPVHGHGGIYCPEHRAAFWTSTNPAAARRMSNLRGDTYGKAQGQQEQA